MEDRGLKNISRPFSAIFHPPRSILAAVLAGALLSVGCSDSTEKTAAATPTPVSELTAEQKAAIKNPEEANKAAEQRKKKEEAIKIHADAAVAAPQVDTVTALQTTDTGDKPTPTP
jgi:hypothetical protein